MNNLAIDTSQAGKRLQEWKYGWGVVLAATIGVGIGNMHMHFIGTMIKPFESAYGWTRAEVAFGLTIMSLLSPLTYVVSGLLADRFGARRCALVGVWTFGLGFLLMGISGPSLWTWYLACGTYAFLSMGVGAIVWTSVVVKRFTFQRGLALALSLAGGGFMVGVTPMLVIFLMNTVGIRGVFFVIGGCGALLMLVPTLLFFHDREPVSTEPLAASTGSVAIPAQLPGYTIKEALQSRQFWSIGLALFFVSSCIGMFMVHLQPMLIDAGLSAQTAASVAFFIGPTMIFGRLFIGFLFDIFDARIISAVTFLIPGIACFMLLLMNGNYWLAALTGMFIGLGMGAEVDVIAYLTSRYFGVRHYGVLFAILVSINSLGVGAGSVGAGAVFDALKSYNLMLIGLGCGALVAVVLGATLGVPRENFGKAH